MCYSAMIEKAYRSYLRMTGAEMDLHQFAEIYGLSVTDSSVRIPRAVDRWFDEPSMDPTGAIREDIRKRNEAMIAALTADLFRQRRRLADAERTLAKKATKKALEDQRIATEKIERALGRLPLFQGTAPTQLDARIFPMHFAPVVIETGGRRVIRLARYHCRPSGKPAAIDRQFPGLYNARRDNLERFWRGQFGATHAVMLVESFFENVDQQGRNVVLHFNPRPAQLMRVACLYSEWKDPQNGQTLLSCAAITDEPPPEVAAAGHDRCIVNLAPSALDRWLAPQGRPASELQALLDERDRPYYEHEVLAA
jgi:putative SOS response-associated peptidase YedK